MSIRSTNDKFDGEMKVNMYFYYNIDKLELCQWEAKVRKYKSSNRWQ